MFQSFTHVTLAGEGVKCMPLLCANGLLTRRDLLRAIVHVTRDLCLLRLNRRTASYICLIQQARGIEDR